METCCEYFVKIIALFFVTSTLLAISVCQDDIAQVYNDEDYFYDTNSDSIIGYENDDDDFQSPALAELGNDIAAKKSKLGYDFAKPLQKKFCYLVYYLSLFEKFVKLSAKRRNAMKIN